MTFPTHASRALSALVIAACCACSSTDSTDTTAPEHYQSAKPDSTAAHVAMSVEEATAKSAALAAPGPEHAELISHAGTWKVAYKFRWAPDAPWETAKGTVTSKPVLDGRYLMEEHSMEMMGMPMNGLLFLGFDNMSKEYTSLWMDTGTTWAIAGRGKESADGVTTLKGTMKDIAGERPYRMEMRTKSDGSIETEMYDTIGGRDVLVMTYTSTRTK